MFDNWDLVAPEDLACQDVDEVLQDCLEVVPLNLENINYLVWRTANTPEKLLDKYHDGLRKGDLYVITLFTQAKCN